MHCLPQNLILFEKNIKSDRMTDLKETVKRYISVFG